LLDVIIPGIVGLGIGGRERDHTVVVGVPVSREIKGNLLQVMGWNGPTISYS
jgi:hypothetical protein